MSILPYCPNCKVDVMYVEEVKFEVNDLTDEFIPRKKRFCSICQTETVDRLPVEIKED